MSIRFIILVVGLLLGACTASGPRSMMAADTSEKFVLSEQQNEQIQALMAQFNAPSLALGVIRDGVLVLVKNYGEQAPGVPLSSSSMFNTASVHKAVTAETVLRLTEKGLLDLDEPLSPHYVHPDLLGDPRHRQLTPRIVLTHKTGFLNWPFLYPDGKLAFLHDPGGVYGYSGIGFVILSRAIAAKLGKPWPQIVREQIYQPLNMRHAATSHAPWIDQYRVVPANADGSFDTGFELEYGYWNSADDLYVSVEDYAKFLISVMNNDQIGPELAAERVRVQSDLTENEIWGCDGVVEPCPEPFGHGIGWFVFGYDGVLNIQHGGNDQTEAAIAYIEPQTGNGAIVFVNSTRGVFLWPKVVEVIDQEQKFTRVFNHVIEKFLSGSE